MTNVSATPQKVEVRSKLRKLALQVLEEQGWTIEPVSGHGRARVKKISKEGVSRIASFKTTQDQWLAYVPNPKGGWWTLSDVDVVVVASVDDRDHPQEAWVHIFDARELEKRYDRAHAARKAAGHNVPDERGIWISLYERESQSPTTLVGAGAGLDSAPVARKPLQLEAANAPAPPREPVGPAISQQDDKEPPLSIPEAKRRLALTLGVAPESIKISVEA